MHAKRTKGYLQCMHMESELPVYKTCGFSMENTLILKRILNIKFVLNNWLQNQKSLEPLEIPNNYVSCVEPL